MVRPVTDGAVKKHRHDLGHEDHGPILAAHTTRGIQVVLALWIAGTIFALIWAAIDAGTSTPVRPRSAPVVDVAR